MKSKTLNVTLKGSSHQGQCTVSKARQHKKDRGRFLALTAYSGPKLCGYRMGHVQVSVPAVVNGGCGKESSSSVLQTSAFSGASASLPTPIVLLPPLKGLPSVDSRNL